MGSAVLFPVFGWVYQARSAQGFLTAYEVLNEQMLVGLDGTEYFSSDAIHCPQCSHRTHKGGQLSYQHTVNLPVIVAPGQEQVISLMPEFIRPQDGAEKQDSRPLAD
jgi:hypothetical protein